MEKMLNLSRRSFLASGATVATAACLPFPLRAQHPGSAQASDGPNDRPADYNYERRCKTRPQCAA
jgi:hypothetical protein